MHRFITTVVVFLSVVAGRGAPPPSGYVLGPNDQINVTVTELPEFNGKSYRIDEDGTVSLPLLGRVQAGGLTLGQLENNLYRALQRQVITPHITANLVETRAQTIAVMGSVNNPGTQPLNPDKTLFDAVAAAGGLKPEAGDTITITRPAAEGPIDLPTAVVDKASGRTSATVKVRDLVELRDSHANIRLRANDEISIPRGPILYVIGNVHKPGGFTISEGRQVFALEALSLAEGFSANAAPASARILREAPDKEQRQEIPVNLKKILAGKQKDVQLSAGDILYIPDNTSRRAATKVMETALATISGIIVWRGI